MSTQDQPIVLPDVAVVRAIVEHNFPDLWPAVDLGLSTAATLLLAENTNPTAVIYVGGPSTGKTTVATMFDGAMIEVNGKRESLCYRSDKFTPASFVSQAANQPTKALAKVDLLPRIKDKILLTPELATIFRGKPDELTQTFSTITRVLDGQGLQTDSGTHGRRGYTGQHGFAWIGCTTPFEPQVWRVMAQLGSRLFFLVMETGRAVTVEDLLTGSSGPSYPERLELCRAVVHKFLEELFVGYGGVRAVRWIAEDDPDARLWLARCAMVLAAMRAVPIEERDTDGGSKSYRPGQRELPFRAQAVLTNVARGHALAHGRRQVTMDDLPLVAAVTVSSMPGDTSAIFGALITNDGALTVEAVQEVLKARHRETARDRMRYLEALGVVEFENAGPGKTSILRLRPDWAWCASPDFRALLSLDRVPVCRGKVRETGELVTDPGRCVAPITNNLVQHQREEERRGGDTHIPQEMTGGNPAVVNGDSADIWNSPINWDDIDQIETGA